MDEELGPENHPELWMRFAVALGASREEVEATVPLPSTSALVHTMMGFCKNSSFQEGLASLYAYEAQVPEVSRSKIEGLRSFFGITDPEAIKFFSVHQEADVQHSQSERDMLAASTPQEHYHAVEFAAKETAAALWGFLDGVQNTFVVPRGAMC
jgi:pyrroloquinoline-quinone synthase